jgi:hypothetical protein
MLDLYFNSFDQRALFAIFQNAIFMPSLRKMILKRLEIQGGVNVEDLIGLIDDR